VTQPLQRRNLRTAQAPEDSMDKGDDDDDDDDDELQSEIKAQHASTRIQQREPRTHTHTHTTPNTNYSGSTVGTVAPTLFEPHIRFEVLRVP
jgi:hypothetical protein